jgi:3-dehydroquinate dehydratase/shikimate dehydrogenase
MSEPSLCVTVTAPTMAELRQRRDAVADLGAADLIEMRLDTVSDPDVGGALAGRRCPVVITCRPTWEGGHFQGEEGERHRLLGEALALGAEYVDIEWRARFGDLIARTRGNRIVLSMHEFEGVPSDLEDRARAMRQTGAEILKIAVRTNRLSDCLPLLELGKTSATQGKLVLVGMGPHGLSTRVLPGKFGSSWTYAGALGDVGQLSPAQLLKEYHFEAITDATAVYGLTGSPISHSVSPAMHNAAFRAARIDAVYLPLPAADADDFLVFARALGVKGASVTIPFKVPLFDRMHEVDDVARRIGAVNTIRAVNGHWLGSNTDAQGFLEPLQRRGVALAGARASVLGAGGAARAVAIALRSSGADVCVHARTPERAQEVAAAVSARLGPWPPESGSWDLLINCTPIGMHPKVDETPVAAEALTGRLVYDLVYNPRQTRLLNEAKDAGCQTIGGLEMLVAQAHEQFRTWTGVPPPDGVMRDAAIECLSEFEIHANHVI